MKKLFTLLIVVCLIIFGQTADKTHVLHSRSTGAPAGHTGSPADGITCTTSGCHAGPSATPIPNLITSNIPPSGYVPGQTYTMQATAADPNKVKFGFQVSPQSNNGTYLGSLVITNATTTKIVGTKYITHTSAGVSAPGGVKTWSFDWIAPAAGTGDVTFYGAFNLTNNSGTSSGDAILTSTLTVMEDLSVGLSSINDPYQAVLFPIPAKDNLTIRLNLKNAGLVAIDLMSLNGSLLESNLISSQLMQGNHEFNINLPANITSGVYFLRVTGDNGLTMKRIAIMN